jgi:uncharacterized protein
MQPGELRQHKPWYRHPWVWLLIALPATAVVAGMISLYLAITTSDGLVVDDYYERGKAINRDLARDQAALAHQLKARLDLDQAGHRVVLILQSHDYVLPRQPRLSFLHPTQQGFDQHVVLDRVSEGQYSGRIRELKRGKWYVQLEADDWRLSGRLYIPLSAPVVLSPRYTDEDD